MASGRASQQLLDLLADQLGRDAAAAVVTAIARSSSRPDTLDGVLVLLEELAEEAPKAARGAIDALADLHRRGLLAEVVSWLDLGWRLPRTPEPWLCDSLRRVPFCWVCSSRRNEESC